KTIRDRFGEDRILTCGNKVLDRGDSSGIKAAAVDLLCLSMGREIYGSSGSSFADTAAHLGNINCTTLKVQKPG
ncbi:MAG: hypothetical protein K6E33_07035, partial [Lachnospiraceae bacterium]|nr:hypothetical protein [Lachnospiraceae bacterium]